MHPAAGAGAGQTPRRRARRLAVAGLVAAMAVAVTGCGDSDDGSGSEPTAAESWASDMCSTVGAWTTTIADARTALSSPRDLSANEIESTFAEVRTATTTLVEDLGDLGAPDTDAGDEAEERIASLSEQLQEQADIVEDAVGGESQGMAERLAGVSTVSAAVAQMISDAQAAVADIRTLDGAQELEDAISGASSCQDLTS